jgi:1,4-dihydroxy-2-naphthoate octaprenyltransferase
VIASRSYSPSPPRWRVWLIAARPRTLTTSTTPILVATLLAWPEQSVSPGLTLLMLIASMMTHAGCNFTNDYFDSIRGVDSVQTHGPGGVLQGSHITSDDLRRAITISFGLALLSALPVMISIGWIVLVIALFAAGVAFFYTAGPYPLAYNRMGEAGVFLAMGVAMVCGTYYVHTGTVTGTAFALSCSIGLFAAAILHSNNTRDAEVDRAHSKITLANTLGRTAAVREYALLVLMPLLITVALVLVRPQFWPLLVALLALPLALRVTLLLKHCQTVAECNSAVPQSAQLHMKYAVLVGIGLVIMRIPGQ